MFTDLTRRVGDYVFVRGGVRCPDGRFVRIRTGASDVLMVLVNNLGKAVAKDRIHHILYGLRANGSPEPKIIQVYVCMLRKILREKRLPFTIHSQYDIGYTLFQQGAHDACATAEHKETIHS